MRGEFVDLNGARLYCYAFGNRGAGDPIVMVHGVFLSSHLWQDYLPRLPEGHRVLVFDLLGHGRSDPAHDRSMTVAAHAERLHDLLLFMGISKAVIVGHDMGAAVAMRVARNHPELVSHLVLINPMLEGDQFPPLGPSRRLRRLRWFIPLWKLISPQWLASALHAALLPGFLNRDAGARSLDVHLNPFRSRAGRETACRQLVDLGTAIPLAGSEPCSDDSDTSLQAHTLDCPVAVIAGASDPFSSESDLNSFINVISDTCSRNVSRHTMAGIGHVAPEEAPDHLGRITAEFLK